MMSLGIMIILKKTTKLNKMMNLSNKILKSMKINQFRLGGLESLNQANLSKNQKKKTVLKNQHVLHIHL
jgi:hypothetical protein